MNHFGLKFYEEEKLSESNKLVQSKYIDSCSERLNYTGMVQQAFSDGFKEYINKPLLLVTPVIINEYISLCKEFVINKDYTKSQVINLYMKLPSLNSEMADIVASILERYHSLTDDYKEDLNTKLIYWEVNKPEPSMVLSTELYDWVHRRLSLNDKDTNVLLDELFDLYTSTKREIEADSLFKGDKKDLACFNRLYGIATELISSR